MSNPLFDDQPGACPRCENAEVVPIVYREPNEEMLTAQQLGHIILRQPSLSGDAPEWHCPNPLCNQDF